MAIIAVMFYGASLIWQAKLEQEAIFQFIALLLYIAPHVQKMSKGLLVKQQLDVYARRLTEILDTPKELFLFDKKAKKLTDFTRRY